MVSPASMVARETSANASHTTKPNPRRTTGKTTQQGNQNSLTTAGKFNSVFSM